MKQREHTDLSVSNFVAGDSAVKDEICDCPCDDDALIASQERFENELKALQA